MPKYRPRKRYPKDIGKRWCIHCAREVYFRWSDSQNTYVCELCQYDIVMKLGDSLIQSEKKFLELLEELRGTDK